MSANIEGQLSPGERQLLSDTIRNMPEKPRTIVEVGTWLGGGSTFHILRALHENGVGRLWGVEADKDIYEKMIANIRAAVPEAADRFTPLLGMSNQVLPDWLKRLPEGTEIDLAFLDGGENPGEQIEEFNILADHIKTGGILLSHDGWTRKGKWLVPYVSLLDNWEAQVFELSPYGLFHARKLKPQPSAASRQAAQRKLSRMRLQPLEFAARYTPSWLCGFLLRAMPKKLARKLVIGKD